MPDTYVFHRVIPDAITQEFLLRRADPPLASWPVIIAVALCTVIAVVALVAIGFTGSTPARWSYAAAATVFVLSTVQAAPMLSFASRLGRAWWGAPLRRIADAGALAGVVTAPVLILLETQLPDWRDRASIWQGWPGAPQFWDSLAIVLLALAGLALCYAGAIPDVATFDTLAHPSASHRPHHSSLITHHWRGTNRQWAALGRAQIWLGALYLMLFAYVHLLVVSDLAMSLVPAWGSANMPPYQVVTSLEGGVAAVLVALWAVRRFAALERYIHVDTFHAASKILLALALLWFYFFWSEFLTYWYGRTPDEQHLLSLLMFGPYFAPFLGAFLLSFVAPLLLLIWNPVRHSIRGVTLAAALALAGCFLDRIRLYVPSWSIAGPYQRHLDTVPATQFPGLLDVLVLVCLPIASLLVPLLFLRLVPPLSLWELKAIRLLRGERPYVKTTVPLIAKPS